MKTKTDKKDKAIDGVTVLKLHGARGARLENCVFFFSQGEAIPIETWENHMRMQVLFPIVTKADYEKALKIAGAMVPRTDLNKKESAYLDSLATLIEAYENKHYPIKDDDATPLDNLKFLMEENGINGSALGDLLGQRQLGAKILNGTRQLSKEHIRILSKHFSVNPSLFL